MGELDSGSGSSSMGSRVSRVSMVSTLLLLSLALAFLPLGQGYPYPAKRDNMAHALQYLSQLDQSFSSHIRPSSLLSKKASSDLGFIEDALSMRVRPRFGKRSYLHNLDTWADILHPPRHLREDYMVRPSILQK